MTRTRQPKPPAPPLAATLRAALASDWRTLAALDTLTAARGSDARRLVHEALRALRAEGCALEERVGRGGVEVRLLTLPAPVPDDGDDGLDANDREAARVAVEQAAWERAHDPRAEDPCPKCGEIHEEDHCLRFATLQPAPAPDAPAPPVGQGAPGGGRGRARGAPARTVLALRQLRRRVQAP